MVAQGRDVVQLASWPQTGDVAPNQTETARGTFESADVRLVGETPGMAWPGFDYLADFTNNMSWILLVS